jgi:3-oxoacyl-[acyl-carrier-protein] synthase II
LVLGTNVGRVGQIAPPADASAPGIQEMLASDFRERWADHHCLAQELKVQLELRGEAVALTGACASGALALGYAYDLVAGEACKQIVAGGADELTGFKLSGHCLLGSAGRDGAVRPFDARREGTAFGEGAGFVIMESVEHCLARGVRPMALLTGYGVGSDTGSLTAPDPEGTGAKIAMRAALEDAGLAPAQIDHIQAHGTGTRLNDAIEARAIHEVFGPSLSRMTVSADKGAIGHTFGASGVLSAILIMLMMREGVVLPVTGCEQLDQECDLPLVLGVPVRRRIQVALCNSFGFGGSNASLVIERYEGNP